MGKIVKKLIFIVDDSEADRLILEKELMKVENELDLRFYENGEEALKDLRVLFNNGKVPCAIFVDIDMPVMDGFEFLDEMDDEFDGIESKVIVLTHSKFVKDVENFGKQKISKSFINKPLQSEEIAKLLEIVNFY